jgi:hypothetical protein
MRKPRSFAALLTMRAEIADSNRQRYFAASTMIST